MPLDCLRLVVVHDGVEGRGEHLEHYRLAAQRSQLRDPLEIRELLSCLVHYGCVVGREEDGGRAADTLAEVAGDLDMAQETSFYLRWCS